MVDQDLVTAIRQDGIAFAPALDHGFLKAIRLRLSCCPTFPGHVKTYGSRNPSLPTRCYEMHDVLRIPGFLDYALGFARVAQQYLAVDVPKLCSFNAFWTFPQTRPDPGLHEFHTDNEGHQLAIFIYGTDILSNEDGAHHIKGPSGLKTAIGRAGTVFLTDPSYPHKGLMPQTNARLLLWARWDMHERPHFYDLDELSPLDKHQVPGYPSDPWLQQCCDLVAR